jgi:hypothetical protein
MSESGDAGGEREPGETLRDRLYESERDPRRRRALTGGGLVVGLLLATVHWSGLFVGGALVGLAQPTLRRAVLAGLGFGVTALVVAAVSVAIAGTLEGVLGTWPLVAVGVVVPLAAGVVGALARGLLPDASLAATRDWD